MSCLVTGVSVGSLSKGGTTDLMVYVIVILLDIT
jgi:hypothetical protein